MEFENVVRDRRSIRAFRPDPVPHELIAEILDEARWSPSFFTAEKDLESDYVLFDSGLIVQSVCLAAHDRGLGTCIMAMAVRDPDTLRELLPHSAGSKFVMGVALGYADEGAAINRFERQRAPLEELVAWA